MTAEAEAGSVPAFSRVQAMLDREANFSALPSLALAMRFELPACALEETVIAFDANVLLRLNNHPRCEDIIDVLRASCEGRLILPGQVIQEFWNNQFAVIPTVAVTLRKKFDDFREALSEVDSEFGDYASRFDSLIDEFNAEFGYVFDENSTRRARLFLELLQEKAKVPFVSRSALFQTAQARKRTKTPPGFKDTTDGDFYVWADLLLGLAEMKEEGAVFQRVALVTMDKKIDWSRQGVPHPILSAEVGAICGAGFETITINELAVRLLD